jgi:hypothetical protein
MPALQRSVATLRVIGDSLNPEEITLLLGAAPTFAQRKGDVVTLASGRSRTAKSGMWRISATPTEPEDFNAQVAEMLLGLTADLSVWRDLARSYRIDIFCGWFMGGGNEGASISADTLLSLGERGIALEVDIYGPDGEA